ncbi:MAG: hypothetical protein ACFFG0_01235 [Candidatus Thorarchaeota archaeon]
MIKVDITMVAVVRPDLVRRTLKNIVKNIVQGADERFRLIINIDPIGTKNIKPEKVAKVAKEYFNDVTYRVAKEPSFPKAVKWVWQQSDAPFIFHIEDDWDITRKIKIKHMLTIMKNNPKLSSLRLYKYRTPKRKVFTTFGCKWRYNKNGFYVADKWQKQFGLNPILIRREFLDEALPQMKDNVNPEKQFRDTQPYMKPIIKKWKYALYTNPGDAPLAIDTGTKWRNKTKFRKPRKGSFITWDTGK